MYSFKIDSKTRTEINKHLNRQATSTENAFIEVLDDRQFRLKMVLDLEVLAPVYVSEYGQSMLCKFISNEQYGHISEIEELIKEKFKAFEVKPLVDDETFFLKLQTKDGKYKAKFDVEADPEHPEKLPIESGTPIVVFCKPGVWMNFEKNKAGVYLQIEKINFEQPKKKIRTKK